MGKRSVRTALISAFQAEVGSYWDAAGAVSAFLKTKDKNGVRHTVGDVRDILLAEAGIDRALSDIERMNLIFQKFNKKYRNFDYNSICKILRHVEDCIADQNPNLTCAAITEMAIEETVGLLPSHFDSGRTIKETKDLYFESLPIKVRRRMIENKRTKVITSNIWGSGQNCRSGEINVAAFERIMTKTIKAVDGVRSSVSHTA